MIVWVKVIGLMGEERHALQTMLRLSFDEGTRFRLWSPGMALAPNVLLIDSESHEAALEIQSRAFNPKTKSIVVGRALEVPGSWRVLERPVDWSVLLGELKALFVAPTDELLSDPEDANREPGIPPGYKRGLIVGLEREQQMYLKARLALQGIAHVDECQTVADAMGYLNRQAYDVLILSQILPEVDVPALVQGVNEAATPRHEIITVSSSANWKLNEKMGELGVLGVLELPFSPQKVGELFACI